MGFRCMILLHATFKLISRYILVTMKKTARAHVRPELQSAKNCPVETTIEVIGGRWKCPIIHQLMEGTKRFNELRREIPDASQRMLTKHLRELEKDGVIHREVFAEVPPRTEYSLTEIGSSLEPVLVAMADWSINNLGAKYK